jgi:hypothetical protein
MLHQELRTRIGTARLAVLPRDPRRAELSLAAFGSLDFMAFHENTDQFRRRRGQVEFFDEVVETGHDVALEQDWTLCRSLLGCTRQRDAARWWLTNPAPGQFNWSWLDRLAAVGGDELILDYWHYGYPHWIDKATFLSRSFVEHAAAYAGAIARRYPQIVYHCPCNELRIAVDLMSSDVWRPWLVGRREVVFEQIARATIAMSWAIKQANPRAQIVTAEPVNSPPDSGGYDEHCAPYDALLGRLHPEWGGADSLLDVIGVNHYSEPDNGRLRLRGVLLDLRARYPDKQLWITEASNRDVIGYLCYILYETLEANRLGAKVAGITQAPVICSTPWTGVRQVARGGLLSWKMADPAKTRRLIDGAERALRRFREAGYLQ